MNNGFHHTEEAIKQRGEVFTPTKLVKQMLGKLPQAVFKDHTKTFIDNSCGNAQFLFQVLKAKMWWLMKNDGKRLFDAHKQALKTIYGCELDPKNAEDCRLRLLNGSTSKELRAIVDHNIITADALDPKHEGWKDVGFYWDKD
jgi:type I restriction-modification system DNA methylase subunit